MYDWHSSASSNILLLHLVMVSRVGGMRCQFWPLEDDSGIVEMICSVTGINPEDITLDLSDDGILPLKKFGGEEE